MKEDNIKTVYRYDSGGTGFKKATYFLLILAGILIEDTEDFKPKISQKYPPSKRFNTFSETHTQAGNRSLKKNKIHFFPIKTLRIF